MSTSFFHSLGMFSGGLRGQLGVFKVNLDNKVSKNLKIQ